MAPHPLDDLTVTEIQKARDIVLSLFPDKLILFREIYLSEPPKKELREYLNAENAGHQTKVLGRRAFAQYEVIGKDKVPHFNESIIDLNDGVRLAHKVVDKVFHAALTLPEFDILVDACNRSQMFKDAVAEYELPEGFEVIIEPWPYGGLLPGEDNLRYFQALCFAQKKNSPESNFYSYPVPIIPVMDAAKQEIIRIDRLATGGKGDSIDVVTHNKRPVDHCKESEYVPELRPGGTRKDLKPINITQPEGPSFSVNGQLIEWQGWRFRLGFNPREGAVLYDMRFRGRSIMNRLSISEMTVPYSDARWPFVRKQAFDFGDGGAGNFANNLALGCDCLGVIKYFDGVLTDASGKAVVTPNVICLHEQDNGIGWKHSNWRTGRAVVTRYRELVVQFIITLANYEYVFAYKLDLAGGIAIETRATGIVNVVNIDAGKTSDYGNVVSPGVLAQNHQHVFAFRMDFAVDGEKNTVIIEESHPVPLNPETNPYGNYYEVKNEVVKNSCWIDADVAHNRVIKVVNPRQINPISQKPVGYKFTPLATQLLLAAPGSLQEARAKFATHHVWVTKHKDGELFAGGNYTLLSTNEVGGVADAVARNDNVEDNDVVVWSVFGLTHNPRTEDWPVMPVEVHELHIKPSDFFTENPSIDVPSSKNVASQLTEGSTAQSGNRDCCAKL